MTKKNYRNSHSSDRYTVSVSESTFFEDLTWLEERARQKKASDEAKRLQEQEKSLAELAKKVFEETVKTQSETLLTQHSTQGSAIIAQEMGNRAKFFSSMQAERAPIVAAEQKKTREKATRLETAKRVHKYDLLRQKHRDEEDKAAGMVIVNQPK